MRTTNLGIELTELPGIEYVRVEPDADSEGGVHATVKLVSMEHPVSFGIAELGEVADAFQTAADYGSNMIDQLERQRP